MSVANHRFAGFLLGIGLRFQSRTTAEVAIRKLDVWAWDREWAQNLKGENPNNPMSAHQIAEARAWGEGARAARGLNPPFPVPPYPEER